MSIDSRLETDPIQAADLVMIEAIQLPSEYDEVFLAPSRKATRLAWDTLSCCRNKVPPTIPAPKCAAIGNGGLTLVWNSGPREVALTIANAAGTRCHIYVREGVEDRLVPLSSGGLANALHWMVVTGH